MDPSSEFIPLSHGKNVIVDEVKEEYLPRK